MGSAIGTAASILLGELRAAGIDRLYLNAGTDFAPLIEAIATMPQDSYPTPTVATHENLAVGMAHGAYLATGRPQAVMLHVSVGTANAICATMNAARDRAPLVVLAGRTPVHEQGADGARDFPIHWAQELFDQGGMIRELVKWDYEVRDGTQVATAVRRALTVAAAEPSGPVYVSFGREALAATVPPPIRQATAVPSSPSPDPAAIDRCADAISAAEFPVIVTSSTGADPSTVAALGELATRHAIGIVEERPRYVNVAHDHEFHLGFRVAPWLADVDVLCSLDCDVPWMPSEGSPRPDAFVIQVGVDPAFTTYPMRTHRADVAVTATARSFIAALDTALAARSAAPDRRADALRSAAARTGRPAAPRAHGAAITRARLNDALGALVDPATVVFSEYWADPAALRRNEPGTFFGLSPAGGLGWGLPAAIGHKLAAPERLVLAAVGDGAYLFANPAACHHASAMHGAPVLTIVNNNARWGAVDAAAALMYPGRSAADAPPSALADLAPIPALEQYVAASGGVGFRVESADDLDTALHEARRVVEIDGRQAVVNVLTS